MQPDTAVKRLEMLPTLARTGKSVNGLFRLFTHRPLWKIGLERIKRNKGAGTPGIDGSKVTDLDEVEIESLIQSLVDKSYRPVPVRRVYIPKANGKLRPLGIPTAKDRLVQEVVRSILDLIYEPVFSRNSHGFRKGRSCHTALEQIDKVWTGVKWIVEVDIEGYFDNIDHSVLLNLLKARIDDADFVGIISLMLKAGFLEDWKFHETRSGTPQGGIVSPLLANIYLHELDLKMDELIAGFDKGNRRALCAEYKSIVYKVEHACSRVKHFDRLGDETAKAKWLRRHAEVRAQLLRTPASDPMDPSYRRLRYVRYADDFLIGIIGSRADACKIMDMVRDYLGSVLHLRVSVEKSGVRKATDGVEFLSYGIRTFSMPSKMRIVTQTGGRRDGKRSMIGKIQLSVPIDKVRSFSTRHRYGTFTPFNALHRNDLLHCDQIEIVDVYNSEMRGFANYYALARDVKINLRKLEYLWQTSLLKTLAAKNATSVMSVVNRYKVGPNRFAFTYSVNGKTVSRKLWKLSEMDKSANRTNTVDLIDGNEWLILPKTSVLQRAAASECHFCGKIGGRFHLHHVNPVRNMKIAGPIVSARVGRSRKTVPMCEECHILLHKGMLPDYRGRQREVESRVQ